jgi:hypothetical protein
MEFVAASGAVYPDGFGAYIQHPYVYKESR